ncbi:MAG: hypothetical protein KA052_00160 [Candidatus Pacebacteria bacterium]|nr:hypothetical protein [Candidatus Paceibacterota bacterium]
MQQALGVLSGALIALSAIPYIRDIYRGKTTPQRMTWFIWIVLLTIAFFAQVAEGGTWSLITTFVDWLGVLIIFILSIKHGVGGTSKLDIAALIGACIGLILWYLTNNPMYALVITIVIDFFGGFLTMVKTHKDPHSETAVAYMICGTGGLLGAISVGKWDIALIIFPLWICLFNYTIGIISIVGKRKLAKA